MILVAALAFQGGCTAGQRVAMTLRAGNLLVLRMHERYAA
jgi:hypothetical protein